MPPSVPIFAEHPIVLADDLTGANEIGAALLCAGRKALVFASSDSFLLSSRPEGEHTIVVNMDSRGLPGARARALVSEFLRSGKVAGRNLIYYKIDSTIRGNPGHEFDGILDAEAADMVVVTPALPQMGRITIGGYHLVNSTPVGASCYGDRSTGSHLPSILGVQTRRIVGHVCLGVLEDGSTGIKQALETEKHNGADIVVVDCVTRTHLEQIARAVSSSHVRIVPAGSVGLFEALVALDSPPVSPCLIICGSINETTRRQIDRLRKETRSGYVELDVSSRAAADIVASSAFAQQEANRLLAGGYNLIVATKHRGILDGNRDECQLIDSSACEHVAHFAARLVRRYPVCGIIVTGGETALAVLRAMGSGIMKPFGEIEPRVPVAVLSDGQYRGMFIVTKTGGFGSDEVFVKAMQQLRVLGGDA